MDLQAFNALDQQDQFHLLFEVGVLLLDRNDDACSYLLYQIDGFYLEVGQRLDAKEISGMVSFNSTDLLEPYLESIDISICQF